MRFSLLVSGSLIVSAIAMYACSSSDPAVVPVDAGKTGASTSSTSTSGDQGGSSSSGGEETSSSSSGESSTTSSTSGDGGGGTTTSSSSSSTSASSSSGAPTDGGTAGTLCTVGAIQEVEPNDSAGAAQVIPATTGTAKMAFCGRISSATDVDFITYTFNVTGTISISGGSATSDSSAGQKITITVDGVEQEFKGTLNVKSGKPTLFKVTGTKQVDYKFNLDVTQN